MFLLESAVNLAFQELVRLIAQTVIEEMTAELHGELKSIDRPGEKFIHNLGLIKLNKDFDHE